MTDFTIHTTDSAPEASRELLAATQAKYGFVPNLMGEMAEAPSMLEAYMTVGMRSKPAPSHRKNNR